MCKCREGGHILIRFSISPFLNEPRLASFLISWRGGGRLKLITKTNAANGRVWLVQIVKALELESPESSGISFGIITSGSNHNYLAEQVDSIIKNSCKSERVEILICGPQKECTKALGPRLFLNEAKIVLIDDSELNLVPAWITRKKNMIVERASFALIVISRDRYLFRSDFVEKLQKLRNTLTVLVPKQVTTRGERIPDWVATSSHLSWTRPGILAYDDWSPYLYVNGGIIIAKTDILKAHPWNEFLSWNEMEDVELTRRLTQNGFYAKLAEDIIVETQPMRKGFLEGFIHIPNSPHSYCLPESNPSVTDGETPVPRLRNGATIELINKVNCIIHCSGEYPATVLDVAVDNELCGGHALNITIFLRFKDQSLHSSHLISRLQINGARLFPGSFTCESKDDQTGVLMASISTDHLNISTSGALCIEILATSYSWPVAIKIEKNQ